MLMELTVKKAFIDKNDKGKIYKVGETLHTDELNRVNDLVARGICVIKSLESKQAEKVTFQDNEYDLNVVKDALESINAPVAKNAGVKGVTKAIEALSDESVTALKEALENSSDGNFDKIQCVGG